MALLGSNFQGGGGMDPMRRPMMPGPIQSQGPFSPGGGMRPEPGGPGGPGGPPRRIFGAPSGPMNPGRGPMEDPLRRRVPGFPGPGLTTGPTGPPPPVTPGSPMPPTPAPQPYNYQGPSMTMLTDAQARADAAVPRTATPMMRPQIDSFMGGFDGRGGRGRYNQVM